MQEGDGLGGGCNGIGTQVINQAMIAIDRQGIEKYVGIQDVLRLGPGQPMGHLLAPLAGGLAPGGIARHHASLAKGNAHLVKNGIHALAKLQRAKPRLLAHLLRQR